MLGFALGVLIGSLTVLYVMLPIRSLSELIKRSRVNPEKSNLELQMQCLNRLTRRLWATPGFWFGGSWLGSYQLERVDWNHQFPYYLLGVALLFLPAAIYVAVILVKTIGRELK